MQKNQIERRTKQDVNKQAGVGISAHNSTFSQEKLPETFKADKHIWYQDRIKDVENDLPKYRDAPIEQFGTGELIEETHWASKQS